MRKKIVAIIIAVLVILPFSSYAAPTRDKKLLEENTELVAQIQPLADIVTAAAWNHGITLYQNGEIPNQKLMEGVLYQSLQNQLFVYEMDDKTLFLDQNQVYDMMRQLFYQKELPSLEIIDSQTISMEKEGFRFNIDWQKDFIGAYIYDIHLTEEELLLSADIYHLSGIRSSAEEAPEESLSWLGHIGMRFMPDPSSILGFSLASFSMPEIYEAKIFVQYEEKNLFEIQYPDLFTASSEKPGAFLSLKSADGQSTLSIQRINGAILDLKQTWLNEKTDNKTTVFIREDGRLVLYTQGQMRLAVLDPINGEDSCLVLTMTFPILKPHEYQLYWQFMDNSFVVYSEAFG